MGRPPGMLDPTLSNSRTNPGAPWNAALFAGEPLLSSASDLTVLDRPHTLANAAHAVENSTNARQAALRRRRRASARRSSETPPSETPVWVREPMRQLQPLSPAPPASSFAPGLVGASACASSFDPGASTCASDGPTLTSSDSEASAT